MSKLNIEVIPPRKEFIPGFNDKIKKLIKEEKIWDSCDISVQNGKITVCWRIMKIEKTTIIERILCSKR